jgi:hypothetical protein
MDKHMDDLFEEPAPNQGPDYVALVIEWDQIADDIENEVTARHLLDEAAEMPGKHRTWLRAAGAIGALAALVAVPWVIHRLRD